MKLFPEKLIHFKLNDSQDKTLEKLKRKQNSQKNCIQVIQKKLMLISMFSLNNF
jgi:hypothetical protein